ncbi:MAG: hypothetical protein J6T56_00315, partial [Bacteroidales bacterium]|nr:hypothetical protein [Bacteroidales bacterium]
TTSSCHCVGVTGPVSNVLFHHSKIMAPETGTAGSCCPIGTASATAATDKGNIAAAVDRLHFVGNTISGGCRTIFLNGSSTNHLTNIRVDSNQIVMGYDQDLNLAYCDTLSVQMNRISPRPGINQNHQGVTISNCAVESICRNFINFNDVTYSAPTGLVLNINNCTPASGKRFLIANNVVIGKVAVGYNSSIGNVVTLNNNQADFFHNSILNNRVTTNTTYSVNCLNLTGASSDIQAIGNQLVTIDRNEFPLRIDASITTYFTDYNNYWSDSGNVARDGSSSYATVAALQAVTGGDKYSVSIAPQFADLAQGLQISNFPAFAIVPNLGVNTDYQGVPRGKTSIIGAYTAASLDAALTDYAKTDFSANQSGVNDLYVTLQNAGLDTLTAATIFWNDGTMQKYPWSGKLTPGAVDTVKIGQFKPVAGSFYHVRAWVADPNNGQDGFNGNDTIETTQFVCKGALAGDYAIGKGLDFANLDEAFIALKACGISAPVRLMLTAGTYNPLTISGTITGASSKN